MCGVHYGRTRRYGADVAMQCMANGVSGSTFFSSSSVKRFQFYALIRRERIEL
jgi:hypothetical protein